MTWRNKKIYTSKKSCKNIWTLTHECENNQWIHIWKQTILKFCILSAYVIVLVQQQAYKYEYKLTKKKKVVLKKSRYARYLMREED